MTNERAKELRAIISAELWSDEGVSDGDRLRVYGALDELVAAASQSPPKETDVEPSLTSLENIAWALDASNASKHLGDDLRLIAKHIRSALSSPPMKELEARVR